MTHRTITKMTIALLIAVAITAMHVTYWTSDLALINANADARNPGKNNIVVADASGKATELTDKQYQQVLLATVRQHERVIAALVNTVESLQLKLAQSSEASLSASKPQEVAQNMGN